MHLAEAAREDSTLTRGLTNAINIARKELIRWLKNTHTKVEIGMLRKQNAQLVQQARLLLKSTIWSISKSGRSFYEKNAEFLIPL